MEKHLFKYEQVAINTEQPPLLTPSSDPTSRAIDLIEKGSALGWIIGLLLVTGWLMNFLDVKGFLKDSRKGFQDFSQISNDLKVFQNEIRNQYNRLEREQEDINDQLSEIKQRQYQIIHEIIEKCEK